MDRRPWDSPEVAAEVVAIGGPGAKLVRYDGAERFDVLPLLVATDGAIAAFGHDHRRLRPNVVIGDVDGLTEREWPGACLRIGKVLIGSGIRDGCQTAQVHFPGKRVEALIAMVECESCNMQDRNHAVWALGQLDDPRALPVLEKLNTGNKSNHMSDYRLEIALRHLRHEDNNRFESVLWRWMLPAEN